MSKKIVALDMDDTIVKLMEAIMNEHNRQFPKHKIEYKEVIPFVYGIYHPDFDPHEFMDRPGTFFELEPIDEYVLSELKRIYEAYDLIIITAAFPQSVLDKWRWIETHMPYFPHANFFTGDRKDLINADLLIDDSVKQVTSWIKKGKPALVRSHHWNQELKELEGVTMFDSWKGLRETIDEILN